MSKKYRTLCNTLYGMDFNTLFERWHLIAISRWKYENLPENITSEMIEELFFQYGKGILVERSADGTVAPKTAIEGTGEYLVLQVTSEMQRNLYNKPQLFGAHGLNYEQYNIPAEKCVFMRNNFLATPTASVVLYYIRKIANIERTLEMNINAQKMPYLFKTKNQKTRLTLNNLLEDLKIGETAVFLDPEIMSDDETIKVLNLNAPYVADKLRTEKQNYINELMTFLGINNLPVEKNERLIQGEIDSNDLIIDDNIEVEREMRNLWVKEANEKFGLNIKVRFYNDIIEEEKEKKNAKIYSDTELADSTRNTDMDN